ncbi:MAG: hypothetical protein P4M12_00120 [Gammaproteobacteria bacterium]|nr:hypothetical protein [Gammaproteobacteria bacterium]
MSTARYLCNIIGKTVSGAVGGALIGGVGSEILHDTTLETLQIGAAGATGNAVIGLGAGIVLPLFHTNTTWKETMAEMTALAAISTLGGMLGKVMLEHITGAQLNKVMEELPLDEVAAAMGCGSGVFVGASVGLGLLYLAFAACSAPAAEPVIENTDLRVQNRI